MKLLLAAVLLAGAAPVMAASNIVSNGGFESGFAGWTQFGNTGFTGTSGQFGGIDPTEGSSQAYFGPVGSTGGISQTLATVAGKTYTLTFDVAAFEGGTIFEASVDGSALLTLGGAAQGYTSYSFNFVAADGSTDLAFTTQHNPSYYLLDNVSASAVPEAATWAMMIVGFGLVGATMRRRVALAA